MKLFKLQHVSIMLSLIFVLALVFLYLYRYQKEEHSIVIFIPNSNPVHFIDKTNLSQTPFKTSICSFDNNKRKFIEYNLIGDSLNDLILLDSFDIKIKHIIETDDTVNGLHVIFGNKLKYNTFIKTLDICLINCKKYSIINYFILYDNNLWFLYDKNKLKR